MSTHLPMGNDWPYQPTTVRHSIDIAAGSTYTVTNEGTRCVSVHEYALTSDGTGTYQWLKDSTPLSGSMSTTQGQLHHAVSPHVGMPLLQADDGAALKLTATGARITGYMVTYVVDMTV